MRFINYNKYGVSLLGVNNKLEYFKPNEEKDLPEYFLKYSPKYITEVGKQHRPIMHINAKPEKAKPANITKPQPTIKMPSVIDQANVGIGILSYNRLNCISRLLNSIRSYSKKLPTIIVSDESTNIAIKEFLDKQTDIIKLKNIDRLGIAGNTNRLLHALSEFEHKLILNDDIEILQHGWETFYANATSLTGIHHFCMRQPGLLGAGRLEGSIQPINGISIRTVNNKPHGAVISLDKEAFEKVGYFDESFGIYGMEHVDWSNRVGNSGIQIPGYHDVVGSDQYFRISNEKSAVENRTTHYVESKRILAQLPYRVYVKQSQKSISEIYHRK